MNTKQLLIIFSILLVLLLLLSTFGGSIVPLPSSAAVLSERFSQEITEDEDKSHMFSGSASPNSMQFALDLKPIHESNILNHDLDKIKEEMERFEEAQRNESLEKHLEENFSQDRDDMENFEGIQPNEEDFCQDCSFENFKGDDPFSVYQSPIPYTANMMAVIHPEYESWQ